MEGTIRFAWKPLGQITIKSGGLRFPGAPSGPGLYRFRFEGTSAARAYIGESTNISRRFGNYARPGPSQSTNIRIHQQMSEHLSSGGHLAVDTCVEVYFGNPNPKPLDLSDKASRRVAENAAILVAQQHGDTLLNR